MHPYQEFSFIADYAFSCDFVFNKKYLVTGIDEYLVLKARLAGRAKISFEWTVSSKNRRFTVWKSPQTTNNERESDISLSEDTVKR